MELVEATVTTATATELKLIANWPILWLQAIGPFEIEDKLAHAEIFERPDPGKLTQRMELDGDGPTGRTSKSAIVSLSGVIWSTNHDDKRH